MYISHKNNVVQQVHETEWQCRRNTKGLTKPEYWTWLDSVTTVTGTEPDEVKTVDLSGETGYTIVECNDENIQARFLELNDYINDNRRPDEAIVYNIEWSDDKDTFIMIPDIDGNLVKEVESEERDEEGEITKTNYKMSHFSGDDTAKTARLLAEQWVLIRLERDRLLRESDWTQASDTALTSAKVTAWAT